MMKSMIDDASRYHSLLGQIFNMKVAETGHSLLGYNRNNAVWYYGSRSIQMLDYDWCSISSPSIIETLSNSPYCWALYETDRGCHAFRVDSYVACTDPGVPDEMASLGCDRQYAALVPIRGYCVRVGPKVIFKDRLPVFTINGRRDKVSIPGLYYAGRVYHHLGRGMANPKIVETLNRLQSLIQWFINRWFSIENMKQIKHYGRDYYVPTGSFIQEAIHAFQNHMAILHDGTSYPETFSCIDVRST